MALLSCKNPSQNCPHSEIRHSWPLKLSNFHTVWKVSNLEHFVPLNTISWRSKSTWVNLLIVTELHTRRAKGRKIQLWPFTACNPHHMGMTYHMQKIRNLNPSWVAQSVRHRYFSTASCGFQSHLGRMASSRCTRSATLWARGMGTWELFSQGISARASM